jgi:uncharacterized protein Usg
VSANLLKTLSFFLRPLRGFVAASGAVSALRRGNQARARVGGYDATYTEAFVQTPSAIERQLMGYRLTTAEILYRLPDHPDLLQTFVWQDLDIAPKYPALNRFLAFWERELDGKLHSVRVGAASLITPGRWQNAVSLSRIH